MFVKRFKKKCDVRGCKNTSDVFIISKRREMGNTIAMCRDCMKEALASTESYTEPAKAIRVEKPLFPHPELEVTQSSVAVVEPEPQEVIEEVSEEVPEAVAEDSVTKDEILAIPPQPRATTTGNKKKPNKKK